MRWTSSMYKENRIISITDIAVFKNCLFGQMEDESNDEDEKKLNSFETVPEASFTDIPIPCSETEIVEASKTENFVPNTHIKNKKNWEWLSLQMQRATIADEDGDRPIHIAVAQENLRLVRQLCLLMRAAKVSVDVTNNLRQTPLHVAVLVSNEKIVNMLLAAGASVHFRDKRGNTPLQLVVKYFHPENDKGINILRSLLSHPNAKATLNITDCEGLTALHEAVSRHNMIAVRELHKAEADINVADGKSGRTSLGYSVLSGNLEMTELLLKCGACCERQDFSGQSSLDFALQSGKKELIRLLEKYNTSTSSNVSTLSESNPGSQIVSKNEGRKKKISQDVEMPKRKKLKV